MIDFRSTRPGVDAVQASYLRLCAAIVYQAVQDVTTRWKTPTRPGSAFAMVARAREEPDGQPPASEEALKLARGKVRRFHDQLKRAEECERNAKSAMAFLLGRDNGIETLSELIGFDVRDFQTALLYGEDLPSSRGIFNDHELVRSRAERWGFKPERFKPGIKWSL